MKEYLIQLKGTFYVDDKDKNKLTGLNLQKNYYKIDENLNIRVDYMSFLIQSENEREAVLSEDFYSKIKDELIDSGYDEEYKGVVSKLNNLNFKLDDIYIKPTGRTILDNGFEYKDIIVDYSEFTPFQISFITKYITRIITSYNRNELEGHYFEAKSKMNKLSKEDESYNEKIYTVIENFYNLQNDNLHNEKVATPKFEKTNSNNKLEWVLLEGHYYSLENPEIIWCTKEEYIYLDENFKFKYKLFINFEHKDNITSSKVNLIISPKFLPYKHIKAISEFKNKFDEEKDYNDVFDYKKLNVPLFKEKVVLEETEINDVDILEFNPKDLFNSIDIEYIANNLTSFLKNQVDDEYITVKDYIKYSLGENNLLIDDNIDENDYKDILNHIFNTFDYIKDDIKKLTKITRKYSNIKNIRDNISYGISELEYNLDNLKRQFANANGICSRCLSNRYVIEKFDEKICNDCDIKDHEHIKKETYDTFKSVLGDFSDSLEEDRD